jgi:hypothetical protein
MVIELVEISEKSYKVYQKGFLKKLTKCDVSLRST